MNDNILKPFNINNAQELFELTNKNRVYLKRTLPWLDNIQTIDDTLDFINACIQADNDGNQMPV
ncbi:hypothetical protein [Moraxella sp.]|uniref:hypothetical protein n=1 Tax=Moraxella sp. TaxID=479 RepID=UPI0026DD5201|nr:hypothetical protein [Moraxella sp.]MDO4894217.1 hypothetical protein [Moraxella sp.]